MFFGKWEFFSSFSNLTCEKLSNFRRRNFGKLVKNEKWFSRGEVCEMNFLKKEKVFLQFRTLSEKISDLYRQKHCRVVKNAFYVSRGTFWGATNFFWKQYMSFLIVFGPRAIFFSPMTRIFQHGFPNCISSNHWKGLSKKIFFLKSIFWFILVNLATNLGLLAKNFSRVVITVF